ncbi:MAG: ATP-binding protein [Planctomycetaceae bacterium]
MKARYREALHGYTFAIGSTIAATWFRLLLEPLVGDRVPFGLYFLSVLLTAWIGGIGPSVAALVLGVLAAAHFIIPPDGSLLVEHPADMFALVVYSMVGAVLIALFHQITGNQKFADRQSKENEQLAARLKDADRCREEFMALLAHELRNPLAPIRTGLELLERKGLDPRREKSIRKSMRRQLEQLVRIVGDLLDVSRFHRGHLELKCETIDLSRVIDMAVETVQPSADEQEHKLKFHRPRDPVYVHGDHLRLTQVVSNLLGNAVKYTPRGGKIQITLESTGREACLQVIDNGIGIARDAQSRIFDIFTQADTTNTREYGGLGLGLAIVKYLVAMHNGTVDVHSEGPGRGTRFWITMPVAPPPKSPLADSGEFDISQTVVLPPGTRVLIVDDNHDAAETLASVLVFEGFATFQAADGPSALQSFDNFQPQIVLLDLGMPGMDGYEIARCMRRRTSTLQPRIIAVTGWGGDDIRRRVMEAGMDHHLVKPVDMGELLQVISGASNEPPLVTR